MHKYYSFRLQRVCFTMSDQTINLVDTGFKNFGTHQRIDHLKPETTSFQYFKSSPLFEDLKRNSHNLDGVDDDILLDGFEIVDEPFQKREPLFYPFGQLTSASVMNFSKSANDQFIKLITESFRSTARDNALSTYKITFFTFDVGSVAKTIEFSENSTDYWIAAIALKRIFLNEDVVASGKCYFTPSTSSTSSSTQFFNILNSGSHKDECTFEFRSLKCEVKHRGSIVFSACVSSLKAVALSSDFEPIRPYVLVTSLNSRSSPQSNSDNKGVGIYMMNSDGNIQTSDYDNALVLSKMFRRDTIIAPLSDDDIINGKLQFGGYKIALVNLDISSGVERGIAAELNIPFSSLVEQQQQVPNTDSIRVAVDKTITKSISVKNPIDNKNLKYRVLIKRAVGLPNMGRKPSAYCTIYLINEKREKLTSNTFESRTDVISHCADPEWNREFLLQLSVTQETGGSYDGPLPHGVMMIVRDQSSGLLRSKHIGQVVIPINCFLLNTEAQFILPLEPTSKMTPSGHEALGEIHVMTELVDMNDQLQSKSVMDDLRNKSERNSPTEDRKSRIRSTTITMRSSVSPRQNAAQNSDQREVMLGFTVRRLWPWRMWWPFRAITGGGNSIGFIFCGCKSLLLRLLPAGAGGVLTSCKEAGFEGSLPDSSEDLIKNCIIVSVPWFHVTSCVEVTETVLALHLIVGRLTSDPSYASKGNKQYVDSEVTIIVGPCPSPAVNLIISHRIKMKEIRAELIKISCVLFGKRTNAMENDMNLLPFSEQDDCAGVGAKKLKSGPWTTQTIDTLLSSGRIISEMIEENITETSPFIEIYRNWEIRNRSNYSISLSSHSGSSYHNYFGHYYSERCSLLLPIYRYYRSRCYAAVLLHLFEFVMSLTKPNNRLSTFGSSFQSALKPTKTKSNPTQVDDGDTTVNLYQTLLPVYTLWSVRKYVVEDNLAAAFKCPFPDNSDGDIFVRTLIHRFDCILESAVQRIRNYILCAASHWDNLYPAIPSSKRLSLAVQNLQTDSSKCFDEEYLHEVSDARVCIQDLISGYHNSLRLLLFPYISSRDSFLKCTGQSFKTGLLRLLIDKNAVFDERIQPAVGIIGMKCTPRLLIVEPERLNVIVEWYSAALVAETKVWLSNTLKNVYKDRTNEFNIPWVVSSNRFEAHVMSELPETLIHTLAVYLSLCSSDIDSDLLTIEIPKENGHLVTSRYDIVDVKTVMTNVNQPQTTSRGIQLRRSIHEKEGSTFGGHSRQKALSKNPFEVQMSRVDETELSEIADIDLSCIINAEDISRQLNDLRYKKKYSVKTKFLLKLNERIVCGICQSLDLLAHEYRRALQGKHWPTCDQEGESSAHINFLVATGNDCMRVIKTHLKTVLEVKVYPASAGGTTEDVARYVIHDFFDVADIASRHVSRVIMGDLQNVLLEFSTHWTESFTESNGGLGLSTALKTIATVLTFYFRNLEKVSEPSLYIQIIGHCAEVITLRYLLFIKERANSKQKLSVNEMNMMINDLDFLVDYFLELSKKSIKTESETNSHNVKLTTSLLQLHSQIVSEELNCSLRCEATVKVLVNTREIFQIQLNSDKEPFQELLWTIAKCYESYPYALGILNHVGMYFTSVSMIRPDTNPGIVNIINHIIDNQKKIIKRNEDEEDAFDIDELLYDCVLRVFGPKNILASSVAIEEPSNSSTHENQATNLFVSGSKPVLSLAGMLTPKTPKIIAQYTSTINSKASHTPAALATALTAQPNKALKFLREKTADINLGSILGKKTESHAKDVEILRILFDDRENDTYNAFDEVDNGEGNVDDEHSASEMGTDFNITSSVNDEDFCIINVCSIKLKGLKSGALVGNANPYVAICIGSQRQKTSVKFKWGKVDEWQWRNTTLSFRMPLSKLQQSKLICRVYDKERVRRKKLLGFIVIKLAGLEVNGITSWFALEGGGDSVNNGQVYLSIQLAFS